MIFKFSLIHFLALGSLFRLGKCATCWDKPFKIGLMGDSTVERLSRQLTRLLNCTAEPTWIPSGIQEPTNCVPEIFYGLEKKEGTSSCSTLGYPPANWSCEAAWPGTSGTVVFMPIAHPREQTLQTESSQYTQACFS